MPKQVLAAILSLAIAIPVFSYSYDNVGNLAGFTYPNDVAHAYTYDTRNRLTNLGVTKGSTNLVGYGYLLDASGHRLSVTEISGRTVNYGYDNLYRLTSETIASDPNAVNGSVSYTYDPVGNRTQKVSTIPGYPGASSSYNADDQLTTDTYDANGNTTASTGNSYAYDFENHLVQQAGLTIVYDGDGNRVAKSSANGTTKFLVDELNPTGYAQVLDEVQNGSATRTYTWGLELISEHQTISGTQTTSYYAFDGHGSVRALTNAAGAITDTYDYDAFGNLIHQTGTTPNNYLFAGEQFDPDLNLYYNRARYLNTSTGRFWSMDNFEGDSESPSSLHKYLYAGNDPVNNWDRSGNDFDLGSITTGLGIAGTISAMSNIAVAGAISAAYGSYPDAVAFGVFVAGEIGSAGDGTLSGIGGYEVVFAPRLMGQRSFWWGGLEPSVGEPLSPSDFGHLAHGRHTEAGIFIAWYWNLKDLNPGNFGIYAIAAGTGFYGYEYTPEGATASLTGQILYNSGVPEVGLFSIGGSEASASPVLSASEGTLATEVAGYEAAFSAIAIASSKGAINPAGGAAATALNAGVGALWVHYTYGRQR